MKKIINTEAELKKTVAYKKACILLNFTDNEFYVALIGRLLVVVTLLDINLIIKNYTLNLSIWSQFLKAAWVGSFLRTLINCAFLEKDITSNVNLLIISKTKIDNIFPKGQFLIKRFCDPFRIDRNINGQGIGKIFFGKTSFCWIFTSRMFLWWNKTLLSYTLLSYNISNHLQIIIKKIDLYSSNYESIVNSYRRF